VDIEEYIKEIMDLVYSAQIEFEDDEAALYDFKEKLLEAINDAL
jgi:hypothetical protein